jgi:hypothetical protein
MGAETSKGKGKAAPLPPDMKEAYATLPERTKNVFDSVPPEMRLAIVAHLKDKDLAAAASASDLLHAAAIQAGLDQWNHTMRVLKPTLDAWKPFGPGQAKHTTFRSPWMLLTEQMHMDKNATFSFDWFVAHHPTHSEYSKMFAKDLKQGNYRSLYRDCNLWAASASLHNDTTVPLLFLCHMADKQMNSVDEEDIAVRVALVAFVLDHYALLEVPYGADDGDDYLRALRGFAVDEGEETNDHSMALLWAMHAYSFSGSGKINGVYLHSFYANAMRALKLAVEQESKAMADHSMSDEFFTELMRQIRSCSGITWSYP